MATQENVDRLLGGAKSPEGEFRDAHRSDPSSIVNRLKASLPEGSTTIGSFRKGGVVPKTGPYTLHKGEVVAPAQTDAAQAIQQKAAQSAAPAQPQQDTAPAPSDDADQTQIAPDEEEAGNTTPQSVNLNRAYSKLNAAVTKMFDELGVARTMTLPHSPTQDMAGHIQDLGKILPTIGGLTQNFLTWTHTKHDSNGGSTVAHPTNKLNETIIPENFEPAKEAIQACRNYVNKVGFLVGKDAPEVQNAKSQLDVVATHSGRGMSAFHLGCVLISLPQPLIRLVARLHSAHKHGGVGHVLPTAPLPLAQGPEQQE